MGPLTYLRGLGNALLGRRSYYLGASSNRTLFGRQRFGNLPSDGIIALEGAMLRERSQHLFRNWSSARSGVNALVDLTISTGVDLLPDTGSLTADARLYRVWRDWTEHASVDGTPLWDLQRLSFRGEVLDGDGLLVPVWLPDDVDRVIPLGLMALSRERLAAAPVQALRDGNTFRDGVELDHLGRPQFFHISNPEETFSSIGQTYLVGTGGVPGAGTPAEYLVDSRRRHREGVALPASDVLHNFEPLHAGQVLGEPWLASVITTIHQEAELVRTELAAAKMTSAMAFVLVSQAIDSAGAGFGLGENANQGSTEPAPSDGKGNLDLHIAPGGTFTLLPGEDVKAFSSTRPSQQIAPFRQMLRGDLAASLRIRQQDLDKDYSRANYSSMRAAQLDLRRAIEPVQNRFGGQIIAPLWRLALPFLAAADGMRLPSARSELRRWRRCIPMPDGFPYVNPKEDIEAAILAIRAGMSTWRDELGWRGKDHRRVHAVLAQELKNPLLQKIFDDKPGLPAPAPENPQPPPPADPAPEPDRSRNTSVDAQHFDAIMQRLQTLERGPSVTVEQRIAMDEHTAQRMGEAIGRNIPAAPAAPAPVVYNQVNPTPVTIENQVRAEAAPVQQIVVQAAAPVVNNQVQPTPVRVENHNTVEVPQRPVRVEPQRDGTVLMWPVED